MRLHFELREAKLSMQALLIFSITLLGVGVLLWWFSVGERQTRRRSNFPVYQSKELLNSNERAFYQMLRNVVGDNSHIFPKVRLADLVTHPGRSPQFLRQWQRVQRRYVDFVLCSPNTLKPVLAVKLESRTERRRRRNQKDILEYTLDAAELPLLWVRIREDYTSTELARRIHVVLAQSHRQDQLWEEGDVEEEDLDRVSALGRFARTQLPTFSRWSSNLWDSARELLNGNTGRAYH